MIDILFNSDLYGVETSFGVRLLVFVAMVFALVMAFTVHEFAHAYIALKNGDRTAQLNGRVSLKPSRHIDPMGFAMVVIVGFGYAKPVPVNPRNFKNRKWGMFSVSIAGITTNIIMSFLSAGLLMATIAFVPGRGMGYSFLVLFLSYFHWINVCLCFFNLIPIFPLDGFNMISSFLRPGNRFVMFMRQYGQYIFLLLIGLSLVVNYFNIDSALWRALDILGNYIDFTAGNVSRGILWLWGKIFRVA